MTHHRGLRYGHCRNVRQSCVWSDTAARRGARTASRIILCQYVRDQESITWFQFGLQSTGETNTEYPSKLIVLPQPEDGLGRTLWPHAALQQYDLLLVQDPLPQPASSAVACCWTRNRRRTRAASWAHAVIIAVCPAMRGPQQVRRYRSSRLWR